MTSSLPAAFIRGGTSKALVFHRRDLPEPASIGNPEEWTSIFLRALGSPDPGGRQLGGMGGGISSLSKVAVVGPSDRPDADVDYTFAQVGVRDAVVGYRGNCGNISSAIGPFAVDEGLVAAGGDTARVRIHNTNTGKIIVAEFPLDEGRAAVAGSFSMQGVAGTGAPVRLAFQEPGGAATGRVLPTGALRDRLTLDGGETVVATMMDVSNPTVFVAASDLGLTGLESPDELSDPARLARFEALRVAAAVAMGLAGEAEARTRLRNLPLVSIVSAPSGDDAAIVTRMISAGQAHKATPLTGAMCLAAAVLTPGTVVGDLARVPSPGDDILISHPSGILPVAATVEPGPEGPHVREAVVYRTQRRLMDGRVYLMPA